MRWLDGITDSMDMNLNSWRKKWQPTPIFLSGKPHEQKEAWWTIVHGVMKNWTRQKWLGTAEHGISYHRDRFHELILK